MAFPPINPSNFEFTIDVHSDDFDEELGEIVIRIEKEGADIITAWPPNPAPPPSPAPPPKPTYASIVGTYQGIDYGVDEYGYVYGFGNITITFYSDGTLYAIAEDGYTMTGNWTQTKDQAYFTLFGPDGFVWTPQNITVYSDGIDGFWGGFYQRVD